MATAKQKAPKERAGRPSQREFILDMAEQLVADQGASRLTFDNLVQVSNISKGGLLYHFGNKDLLIQAMLQRLVERNEVKRKALYANYQDQPDAELRSILLAALSSQEEARSLNSAILAAAATNPELMAPLQEQIKETSAALANSNIGAHRARVLWYAVHGERLFEQLGLCEQACCEEREKFAEILLGLIDAWQPK